MIDLQHEPMRPLSEEKQRRAPFIIVITVIAILGAAALIDALARVP